MSSEEKEPVVDLSKILRPYKGKWVAVSEDRKHVVHSAETLGELMNQLRGFKDGEPVVLRVPDEHTAHLL